MQIGDWIISLALLCVLIASIPTLWEAFKTGNDADPLRREIEEEIREQRKLNEPKERWAA